MVLAKKHSTIAWNVTMVFSALLKLQNHRLELEMILVIK